MTRAPILKGSTRPTAAQMIARRDEALGQIRQLLAEKPLSVVDVAECLGLQARPHDHQTPVRIRAGTDDRQ